MQFSGLVHAACGEASLQTPSEGRAKRHISEVSGCCSQYEPASKVRVDHSPNLGTSPEIPEDRISPVNGLRTVQEYLEPDCKKNTRTPEMRVRQLKIHRPAPKQQQCTMPQMPQMPQKQLSALDVLAQLSCVQ